MSQLENSLRIKVIGDCNRNCRFCHQEGGMKKLEIIDYSQELEQIISFLCAEFAISSIALTGGEPLLHQNLLELVQNIRVNTPIQHFSLTTNGTIRKEHRFWEAMKELGVCKVNISMSDLLTAVPATVLDAGVRSIGSVYDNQIDTISCLNALGITPNINIVVYNDKKYLSNILNVLLDEKSISFEIALLPDLTDENTFEYSEAVIQEIIKQFGLEKIRATNRKGTSNTVCDYKTSSGIQLQVKTTKQHGSPKRLTSICSSCKYREHCQEGFYGLRLEKFGGEYLLRFCLYRSDNDVLMSFGDFKQSPVYSELKSLWT